LAFVRLRPLTEAECYARCYGGRREEVVSFVRVLSAAESRRRPVTGERLQELFEAPLLAEPPKDEAA
jgi:hypothetical protein